MNRAISLSVLLLSVLTASSVWAKTTPQQAARLGADLTPMGAEKAGNASGSIPAWKGGITQPVAGYEEGQFHLDPYAKDRVLHTINVGNWQKYKDQLTQGQIELLKRHPEYTINVYPSHRSAAYPQFVYDAVKKNATTAELQPYGTGVTDTIMASPFPIPQNGAEVLWNHTLRYRGLGWQYVLYIEYH